MKRAGILLAVAVLAFLSAPCRGQDYQVGAGDVLKISVYDNPDLEKVVRVSNEGVIVLPLIGEIAVGGLSVSDVTKKITDLLADGYLISPHVSVFVEEFRSKKVTILGEVNKPGLFEISGNTSFLELISKAQGFTKNAGDSAVIKRRQKPGKNGSEILKIDLKNFVERGDTSVDVHVEDGDSIYVKEAMFFYVNGEVRKPDAYKWEEGITVIKAITVASGFTSKASTKNVRIIRKVKGEEQVLQRAKMDEPVMPDDVIVVPESFF